MDKPFGHYLVLAGIIATLVLILVAIVTALRTPGLKHRWLWCLAALISLGQYGLNWTTGATKLVAMHVAPIGVVVAHEAGPPETWVLKTPIPAGAIAVMLLLVLRHRRRTAAQDIPPT